MKTVEELWADQVKVSSKFYELIQESRAAHEVCREIDNFRRQAEEIEAQINELTRRKSDVLQDIASIEARATEKQKAVARFRALINKPNAVELSKTYPRDPDGFLKDKKGTVREVRKSDCLVDWGQFPKGGIWSIEFEYLKPAGSILPETGFVAPVVPPFAAPFVDAIRKSAK